jgi:hypothetical protein
MAQKDEKNTRIFVGIENNEYLCIRFIKRVMITVEEFGCLQPHKKMLKLQNPKRFYGHLAFFHFN